MEGGRKLSLQELNMDINRTYTAKENSKAALLEKPGVVGIGVGYKVKGTEQTDKLSVVILVEKKKPVAALQTGELLPLSIQSAPTDIVEVGRLVPQTALTDKWRPAIGGVSIGHYKITAGTLGIVVTEKGSGIKLILSNNHVLANTNDAILGDPIYQPGPYDGGKTEDTLASLYKYIRINFGEEEGEDCLLVATYLKIGNWIASILGSRHVLGAKRINPQAVNYMDAALAIPNKQDLVLYGIEGVGKINGTQEAELGMKVSKVGRTTGHTFGTITMVHSTVKVNYGDKVATLENQFLTGAMSAGGDSGSLLYNVANKTAVGLLFAGSSQVTIYSPINAVLNALQVIL